MKPKENLLRAIHHDNPEWVPHGPEACLWLNHPICERHESGGYDDYGVRWDYEPASEGGSYPGHGGQVITDLVHWKDQARFPNPDDYDWSAVSSAAKYVDRDEQLVIGFVGFCIFERSYLLLGMEEALIAYSTEPELMEELAATIADQKIQIVNRFWEETQCDIIWFGDDWGTQSSLFIRPDVWRRVIKPHTQRMYDAAHRLGAMVVQHSCGKIEGIFGDMVEMGADVYNPCQPCNDLARLKRDYFGKIAFCGGIDSQFVLNKPGVTLEEVRAEVRRRIDDLAWGGGYLAEPSQSMPYDPDILTAMWDEVRTYGRYPLPSAS